MVCPAADCWSEPPAPTVLQTDRFGPLPIFRAAGEPTGIVLWFAGGQGDSAAQPKEVATLVERGYTVAVIPNDRYLEALRSDDEECLQFGEVVRLSQVIQNSLRLPRLVAPILAGSGGGESVAYLTAASDQSLFSGLIVEDGCAELRALPDVCDDDVPDTYDEATRTIKLLPNPMVTLPSLALEGAGGACPAGVKHLSEVLSGASPLPRTTRGAQKENDDIAAYLANVHPDTSASPEESAADQFGLVEMPADPPEKKPLLLFLSGDGGWASIDRELGDVLQAHGVNVLGLSSLSFFWRARTAEELADALETIIEQYSERWEPKGIYVGGFSLGADVLPSGINALPEKVRRRIKGLLLLSPGKKVSFEVHLTDWLDIPDDDGADALPEARKVPMPVVCVYGEEDDSICPDLDPKRASIVKLSGGHHFDGDYEALGERILTLLGIGKQ
jgi:type IV secretory pathway VirJ component